MSFLDDVGNAVFKTVDLGSLGLLSKVKNGFFPGDPPGQDEANRLAALYDNLKYTDPSSDPRYAEALKQLQGYASGGLTAADRAREYEALGEAQKFAQGQQGAISQDAAARGGGGAGVNSVREQVAAQGAATRVGAADVATAGMASQRALAAQQEFARQMQINTEMQNQFALQKAGGQASGIRNLQDLTERSASAANANRDSLLNTVAGLGMAAAGVPPVGLAKPATSTGIPDPSLSGTGYVPQDGWGGFKSPSTSLTAEAPAIDTNGAMTASEAAAKAFKESMPFAQMATPGSAPSMASRGPDYGNLDNPTLPRKPAYPSF